MNGQHLLYDDDGGEERTRSMPEVEAGGPVENFRA